MAFPAPRYTESAPTGGTLPLLEASLKAARTADLKPNKPSRNRGFSPPKPSAALLMSRILAWLVAGLRYELRLRWDRLRGRPKDERREAEHLREILQSMGPSVARVSRQFAMRLDSMPVEHCLELANLDDSAPPMDLNVAAARIEAATGLPMAAVFETFDPKPIGSDAVACVYQAILRSGEKVAVKVLHPEAALRINAERLALEWILRVLGELLPDRHQAIEQIRDELPAFLLESLDFLRVARSQTMLRKELEKGRFREVDTTRVFSKLSSEHVIVSEFISGVWLHEVIGAVQNGDDAALEELAAMGIEPKACGRRLLHFCWWLMFENFFLFAAPDVRQLVVRPGGKLTLVEAGMAVSPPLNSRRRILKIYEGLARYDVEGAVALLVELLYPLPPIDVHELATSMEHELWPELLAAENKDSPRWERAGAGFWLKFLANARRYGASVSLETSRVIQASCIYGDLASRLMPNLRFLREFERYRRKALVRHVRVITAKRGRKRRQAAMRGPGNPFEIVEKARLLIDSAIEKAPVTYLEITKKSSYSASQVIGAISNILLITALFTSGLWAYHRFYLSAPLGNLADVLRQVVVHPGYILVVLAVFVASARRILVRLDDMDHDD